MILEDMYRALKSAGLDTYMAGQAEGKVTGPRIVITDGGVTAAGKTVGTHVFYVTAYVPVERPTDLSPLMERARQALAGTTGARATGETDEGEIIDEYGAYAMTAEYRAMCSLI